MWIEKEHFLQNDDLMVVGIGSNGSVSKPRLVASLTDVGPGDIMPDGNYLGTVELDREEPPRTNPIVVVNWFTELNRKLARSNKFQVW